MSACKKIAQSCTFSKHTLFGEKEEEKKKRKKKKQKNRFESGLTFPRMKSNYSVKKKEKKVSNMSFKFIRTSYYNSFPCNPLRSTVVVS